MEENSQINPPKVFISYSYQPPENIAWARRLADKIRAAGISVTTDLDKDPDQDMSSFVVNIVNNTSYTHILVICNASYVTMADSRGKEMEIEGPVIIDRLYMVNENKRFIPIGLEEIENGHYIMPKYFNRKACMPFGYESRFEENCQALIERIKKNNETGTMNRAPDGVAVTLPRTYPNIPFRSLVWTLIITVLFVIRILIRCSNYQETSKHNELLIKYEAKAGWVQEGGKFQFADTGGHIVPGKVYDFAEPFFFKIAAVKNNGKWGFINRDGDEFVHCIYDGKGDYFISGMGTVQKNGKWGSVDSLGNEAVPIIYDRVGYFYNGYAAVQDDRKWGFVNKRGKVIIPIQYDDVRGFREGVASASKGGKWGYIDAENKIVIPFKFDFAAAFDKGHAMVTINGKQHMINHKGDILTDK